MAKVGRNTPCPCGSGKKYKICCLATDEERRRLRLEELERKQVEAKKAAEEENELSENSPEDEDSEDELYDDTVDETEEEEEEEEETEEVFEDSEAESSPRKRVPDEIPLISEAEEAIVDTWWKKYNKMSYIEEIRQHLEDFLRDHPKLVPNLELHMEVLFELGAAYVKAGRNGEYIDLLEQMRSRFPDSYIKSFGYYDRDIISHKIAIGRKDEARNFLGYFKEYPEEDPDNLFTTIEFMMAHNCQEMVTDLIQCIYHDVCTSQGIFGGDELVDILVTAYMGPFLRPDFTDADLEELASKLRTIRIRLKDEFYRPDFLRRYFELILNRREKWAIDDCKTRKNIIERYHEVSLNFMGFLHERKGKDWLAAELYRKMTLRYLVNAIPEGKRPKQPFVFTRNKLDTTFGRIYNSFMVRGRCTLIMVYLNSAYWFAEYIEETGSITEEQRIKMQGWCVEFHNEIFPGRLETDMSAEAFEKFPV